MSRFPAIRPDIVSWKKNMYGIRGDWPTEAMLLCHFLSTDKRKSYHFRPKSHIQKKNFQFALLSLRGLRFFVLNFFLEIVVEIWIFIYIFLYYSYCSNLALSNFIDSVHHNIFHHSSSTNSGVSYSNNWCFYLRQLLIWVRA